MSTTAPPALRTFRVGDKVTPDPDFPGHLSDTLGQSFTVTKVNRVNLTLSRDGGGRGYRCPPASLLPATEENLKKAFTPRPFQLREFFTAGEIVTVKSPSGQVSVGEPMIVLKDGANGKVNITKLGGDGDRYYRWPATSLVKRDVVWLAEHLLDKATAG
jgi:hypothetical protein